MFRNARFLRYATGIPESEEELGAALIDYAFRPCGPLSERSTGWEPPVDGPSLLARQVEKTSEIRLRSQSRVLPAAAINEALEVRLEEFRERMGHDPGRRERSRIKAETRDNLMTKALLRSERTGAFFLHDKNLLCIDASSPTRVERVLEMLRLPFPKVEFSPLTYRRSFASLLKQMLIDTAPAGLVVGRECVLQDSSDSRSKVRWTDMDLIDTTLRKFIKDGMVVTQLGMQFADIMSFTLSDSGALGRVRLLGMDEAPAEIELEDPLARHDAELVLSAGMFRRLLSCLEGELAN